MSLTPFVQGLLIGLAVAAPVGPMSLLCMRRTLGGGFRVGAVSGLGIATADGIYSAVAAFGLLAVARFLVGHQRGLRLVGGAALIYLGASMLRGAPRQAEATAGSSTLLGSYGSMLALTLTNPATILSFIALFAGAGEAHGTARAAAMVVGVLCGSGGWWLTLAGVIAIVGTRLPAGAIRVVNGFAALAIVAFGGVALVSGLMWR